MISAPAAAKRAVVPWSFFAAARYCEAFVIVQFTPRPYLRCRQVSEPRMQPTVPVIALIVAVLGQAAILFSDFRPSNPPRGGGIITAAAVMKAGAIEFPAGP
jgi:hypothetical protein